MADSKFKLGLLKYKVTHWDPCLEKCIVGNCEVSGTGTASYSVINNVPLGVNPTPTGNNKRNQFVYGPTGNTYYIDNLGNSVLLQTPSGQMEDTPAIAIFTVNSGNTVTLPFVPLANYHVSVYRNGLRCYSDRFARVGNVITFITPFGVTPGGQGMEQITVEYFV